MPTEFEGKIIQDFAQDIARRIGEAAVLARIAEDYGKQGLIDRAFQALLDTEELIHDANTLLNASSVVRRRDRERGADFG